jgi:hypothetical protein
MPATHARAKADPNVRIGEVKCDSSHVPRASPCFTSLTLTVMIDGQPNENAPTTVTCRRRRWPGRTGAVRKWRW